MCNDLETKFIFEIEKKQKLVGLCSKFSHCEINKGLLLLGIRMNTELHSFCNRISTAAVILMLRHWDQWGTQQKARAFMPVCWTCAGWHFSGAGAFSRRWLIICSLSFKDWHSSPIFLWWALGGWRWRLSVITTTVLGPADKTLTSDWLCEIQITDLYVAWQCSRRTRVLALPSTGLLGPELPVTHWLLSFIWEA